MRKYFASGIESRAESVAGGINLGSGQAVYRDVDGGTLRFRSLAAGSGVAIGAGSEELTISVLEDRTLDGGFAASVYTVEQTFDCGDANG